MKLQLKHLAPYIPYKLNIVVKSRNQPNWNHTLTPAYLGCMDGVFPVLRPLSDITKKIEVDGEKFVPLSYIYGNDFEPCAQYFENLNELCIGYREMLLLFEWHFDVFGLIGNNLAIDINTL
jgi:hypothetical protein